MSRFIDSLPDPPARRRTRVIGLGCSRTATMGLHRALTMLGYNTLHMITIIDPARGDSTTNIRTFHEAIQAHNNPFSGIKPYSKADFEKWWAPYDAVLEVSSYFPERVIEAYKDDPDVLFVMTDRRPESWAKSIVNGPGYTMTAVSSFPLVVLQYFDSHTRHLFRLVDAMMSLYSDGTPLWDKGAPPKLERFYVDYVKRVKAVAPADRLLVMKLEEGLDWDKLCPFLGKEIPDVPYPRMNGPDEFKQIVQPMLDPGVHRAMGVVAGLLAVAAGGGFWLLKNRERFL